MQEAAKQPPLTSSEQEALARRLMRRQVPLSLQVAAVFVAILIGLPLLNLLAPELMNQKVGGFTLTWLVLGILFYPITWLLSAYFVKRSNDIEAQIALDERGNR